MKHAKLLTVEEVQALKDKRPKPPGHILWEKYLNGFYKSDQRIGEIIEFIRYGDLPKNGRSRCGWCLGEPYGNRPELEGVSVFEIKDGVVIIFEPKLYDADFYKRSAYRGRGKIVRWGPDGEPLVEVLEIRPIG